MYKRSGVMLLRGLVSLYNKLPNAFCVRDMVIGAYYKPRWDVSARFFLD